MTVEVYKTIPVDARNTIIHHHRDDLQARHGIKMFFPRNRVRGKYQEMELTGGSNAIARAVREIDTILTQIWQPEFEAFLQRQAHRKESRRIQQHDTNHVTFPSVAESVSNTYKSSKTSSNMFAALDDLESNTVAPVPVDKPTLKGWAAMAAKPPAKPAAKSDAEFTFGTVGSAAAFTYPDTEHFDWAEESDTQYTPVSSPFFEDGCVNTL